MSQQQDLAYFQFEPELIVEVTKVCDHACLGCYAPNFVSRAQHSLLFEKRPELFLSSRKLAHILRCIVSSLQRRLNSLAFRGGEPTCHPQLTALIDTSLEFTSELFVETHGRWTLPFLTGTGLNVERLLNTLSQRKVCLKISFDSMHKLSVRELDSALHILDEHKIDWLVAITELTPLEFREQRNRCSWIPDSKIVLQPKARLGSELPQPPMGIIRSNGEQAQLLSLRKGF